MATGDPCPTCDGSGRVTVQNTPFTNTFPANQRKYIKTEVRVIDCPVCRGTGKQS